MARYCKLHYGIALHGTVWYCDVWHCEYGFAMHCMELQVRMVLHGIVTFGIAIHCMGLLVCYGIAWYCIVWLRDRSFGLDFGICGR